MIKPFKVYSLVLFLAAVTTGLFGQCVGNCTTLTATLTDGSGQIWTNGVVNFTLVPPFNNPAPILNNGIPPASLTYSTTTNNSGVFTQILDTNTKLTPANSKWSVTLCPNATVRICSQGFITLSTTGSVDLSASISAFLTTPSVLAAPVIQRAYQDSQANGGTGSVYWNTTSNAFKGCSVGPCPANSWQTLGNLGVPGIANQIPFNNGSGAFTASNKLSFTPTGNTALVANNAQINNVISANGAPYNAVCDGVTDDTNTFQAAATAANALYVSTGSPTKIIYYGNCVISGSISVLSGEHWDGVNGIITVPVQADLNAFQGSGDHVWFDNITVKVITPGLNGPINTAIAWYNTVDAVAHVDVAIRNCVVINSDWGIEVFYGFPNGGTGSLSHVIISGNIVYSPTVHTNGDGIHVGGRVSDIEISNNLVYNRNDAAIGLTSEFVGGTHYNVSGFNVTGNTLLFDLVGVDISGATNGHISGNMVYDTTASAGLHNAAFRQIYYPNPGNCTGVYPTNIHTDGNYFYSGNNGGTEVTAKIDPLCSTEVSWPVLNTTFENNTVDGPNNPFYVRGNTIAISGNTFMSGGLVVVDYDGANAVATANLIFGINKWNVAGGTLNFGAGCALYSSVNVYPQESLGGSVNYVNLGCITYQGILSATTTVINGTVLAATCDSGTVIVQGALIGNPVVVSSTTGVDIGGAFNIRGSVTANGQVTVYVCGTGTPASLTYNVRVLQTEE